MIDSLPPSTSPPSTPAKAPTQGELALRVLAAIVMISGLALALAADVRLFGMDIAFQVVLLVVSLMATHEFFRMAEASGAQPFTKIGLVSVVLFNLASWSEATAYGLDVWSPYGHVAYILNWVQVAFNYSLLTVLMAFMLAICFIAQTRRTNWSEAFRDIGATVLGVLYISFLGAFFLCRIRHLNSNGGAGGSDWLQVGTGYVAATILTAKSCDIFAYLGGRLIGQHRMTPRLSPKKTWEGLCVGLLGSMAVAVLFYSVRPVDFLVPLGSLPRAAAFGLVVGLASAGGDLTASLLKRACAAKDSGHVVPGYGGVIDVVDSLVMAAPAAYVFLILGIKGME